MTIRNRIVEARWPGIARSRREGNGIGGGVEAGSAVGCVTDASDCQRIDIGIRVIGQQRRGHNDRRTVLRDRQRIGVCHRRLRRGRRNRIEGDINEIVAGLVGVGREDAGGAVSTIGINAGVRGRGQRAACKAGREVVPGIRINSGRMVGGNIGGAGRYGDWRGEGYRLPTSCARAAEGSRREQRAGRTPQVYNIRTGVPRGPVELDAGYRSCHRRRELDADLDRLAIIDRQSRSIGRREEALRGATP